MSKLIDQITAQANHNASQVYIDHLTRFEQVEANIRVELLQFLNEGCCDNCKPMLLVNDDGITFVPAKPGGAKAEQSSDESTEELTPEEPNTNGNGRGARRRTAKAKAGADGS